MIDELSKNERLLCDLFNGIDFNNTGCIDYPEFLAACLARKEGLKREYAELIFDLFDWLVWLTVGLIGNMMASSILKIYMSSLAKEFPSRRLNPSFLKHSEKSVRF